MVQCICVCDPPKLFFLVLQMTLKDEVVRLIWVGRISTLAQKPHAQLESTSYARTPQTYFSGFLKNKPSYKNPPTQKIPKVCPSPYVLMTYLSQSTYNYLISKGTILPKAMLPTFIRYPKEQSYKVNKSQFLSYQKRALLTLYPHPNMYSSQAL